MDTKTAYLALFILGRHALALQNSVLAVEKEVTETFNAVALPVLYKCLELLNRLDSFFSGNRVVGACEDGGSGFDALGDVFASCFIKIALVAE
jgi:hypothetical protein